MASATSGSGPSIAIQPSFTCGSPTDFERPPSRNVRAGAGSPTPPAGSAARPGEARATAEDGPQIAELLGFEGTGLYRGAFLYFGSSRAGAYLDLLQWQDNGPAVPRSPRDVGLARVAIRVDDMDEHLARLADHGVPTLTAPKELTLGVTRVRVVCFRDPDGVLLEYLQFVDHPWGVDLGRPSVP
jgi:catechol 2,3-dioxygenase-like lactoylglutathione lyase family enzyme